MCEAEHFSHICAMSFPLIHYDALGPFLSTPLLFNYIFFSICNLHIAVLSFLVALHVFPILALPTPPPPLTLVVEEENIQSATSLPCIIFSLASLRLFQSLLWV